MSDLERQLREESQKLTKGNLYELAADEIARLKGAFLGLKKQLEQKTSDERGEAYWLEHYKNSTDAEKAEAVIAFRRSAIAYSRDNERLKAELAAVSASKTEK